MIYHSFNFVDSFSNASGNRRNTMVLGELGKLIKSNPNEVIIALEDSDIKVPRNITKRGLIKLILINKRNQRMISNLSLLIYASNSFNGEDSYDFLGRRNKSGGNSSGFISKVGGWIKERRERKAQRGGEEKKGLFKRIGSFFNKNKDKIGDISSSLADGLQSGGRGTSQTIEANTRTTKEVTSTSSSSNSGGGMKISKNTQTLLIVGGVLAIGYFIYSRNK